MIKRIACFSLLVFALKFTSLHGQAISQQQETFLERHVHSIAQNADFSNADWRATAPFFKNKRLILLGELNHGSKEIFEVRTSLIKYLHENLGIKTILFESGIGEFALIDQDKQQLTPTQMTYGLFGGWRTREFEDLMAYIKSENISIAGFDVQRTGGSFAALLREVASRNAIDSMDYHHLEARYGSVSKELANRKVVYDSVANKTLSLIQDYKTIHDRLMAGKSDSSKMLQFTLATIQNRISYLSYMLDFTKDKDWNKRWAARDSAMALNIIWLCENVYKDEPVIIIGHNYHIGKYNQAESTMGELLLSKYGENMYSLGVFAGAGSYHDNSGKTVDMLPPDSKNLDIKHVISSLKGTANFLDMPAEASLGSQWLNEEIIINDSFINLNNGNKLILSQSFDGLLFIDKVSPPNH